MISFAASTKPLSYLYYETGRALYAHKNYNEALNYFLKALDEPITSNETIKLQNIYYALGKTYHDLERDKESLQNYFLAFEKDPEHNPQLIKEAQLILNENFVSGEYHFLQDWNQKLNSFACSNEAKIELALFQGRTYMLNNKPEDNVLAEKAFNEVLQHNPGHLYALENLGEIYRRTSRFQDALELFEKISTEDITEERKDFINFRKALVFFDKAEYNEVLLNTASLSFQHTFHKTLIHKIRAKSYLQLNEPAKAIEEADKVMISDSTNFDSILIKSIAYVYLGQFDNALLNINLCIADNSTNEEYLFYKARILVEGLLDIEQGKKILQNLSQVIIAKKLLEEVQLSQNNTGNSLLFLALLQYVSADTAIHGCALSTLDKSIEKGITGSNAYPELYAYQLKGEFLSLMGENIKGGEAYFEAAKRIYWEGNYKEATKFFEKASMLNEGNANIYWYSADNYLMQSSNNSFPYSDLEILQKGEQAWAKGISVKQPGKDDAWCYVTKARLHEFKHSHTSSADEEERRNSLYYVIQSIFFSEDDYFNLAFAGHYLRLLGFNLNALHILNKAEKEKPEFSLTKEEKTAALLNLGEWDQAIIYLTKLDNGKEKTDFPSWWGYLYFNQGKYEKALECFTDAIEKAPEDSWNRLMRIQTHWHLSVIENRASHYENILKDAAWLYERKDEKQFLKEQLNIAFAAMFVEKDITKTEQFFKGMLADDDNKSMVNLNLAYFYLKNGKIEPATINFDDYLKYCFSERELAGVNKDIVMIASEAAHNFPDLHNVYKEMIDVDSESSWIKKLSERKLYLQKNPLTLAQEIENGLNYNSNYKEGTIGYNALRLRLAQLNLEEKQYQQVLNIYSSLLPANNKEIFTIGNLCTRLQAPDSMQQYWILKEFLSESLTKALAANEYIKNFYQQLMASLKMPLSDEYELNKSIDMYPVVTPLAIEMAKNLIPADREEWPLIKDRFPRLRDEILATYGVTIPGVRIRENEYLQPDSFYLLFNEVPSFLNILYPDFVFCPAVKQEQLEELGISTIDYIKAETKFTLAEDENTYWIAKSFMGKLEKASIQFYEDHFEFAVAHVRRLVIQNLPDFINLQSIKDDIEKWKQNNALRDKIDVLFSGDNLKRIVQFIRIIKMLVAEAVPVTNIQAIISNLEINDLETDDIFNTVVNLRLILKEQLPGNSTEVRKVKIPVAIEEGVAAFVRKHEGRITLSIPPEDTQQLIADFRSFYESQEKAPVILIDNSFLRYHVKKLLDIEFPELIFLSEEERVLQDKITSTPALQELKKPEEVYTDRGNKEICTKCHHKVNPKWKICIHCGNFLKHTLTDDAREQIKSTQSIPNEGLIFSDSRQGTTGKKPYEER